MSLEQLQAALEALPDPSCVSGVAPLSEPLAIALPDGDVGALDDKVFLRWLLEHAEVAPFGDKGETKVDAQVRNAKRLVARGQVSITGFDPATVLPAIEAVLSPRFHLDARLEDVIVYEKGRQVRAPQGHASHHRARRHAGRGLALRTRRRPVHDHRRW